MASNKLKKHHHVVPRSYLKGWADDAKHVAVLERGQAAARRLPVSHAAVRSSFYNFLEDTGGQSDAVEEWFGKHVESPMGPVLRQLRQGVAPREVDEPAIRTFAVTQLVRTPTVFAYMAQLDTHLGPLLLFAEACKTAGVNPADLEAPARERLIVAAREAWEGTVTGDDRASHLRTMARQLDELAVRVESWHVTVLQSPRPALITSDAPVATLNMREPGWGGLLPSDSPLLMPLSPTQLLLLDPVRPLTSNRDLSVDLARVVNTRLAAQADRAIFNHPALSWPANVVLPAQRPGLPSPTTTWGRFEGKPTLPAQFPVPASAAVAELLEALNAQDVVH